MTVTIMKKQKNLKIWWECLKIWMGIFQAGIFRVRIFRVGVFLIPFYTFTITIVIIIFAPICDLFSFCYPTQKAVNLSRAKIILFWTAAQLLKLKLPNSIYKVIFTRLDLDGFRHWQCWNLFSNKKTC